MLWSLRSQDLFFFSYPNGKFFPNYNENKNSINKLSAKKFNYKFTKFQRDVT